MSNLPLKLILMTSEWHGMNDQIKMKPQFFVSSYVIPLLVILFPKRAIFGHILIEIS